MVETRKQKVETREGTTTEPDPEIHTDYSEDFEEDEPATSVNTTIVQLVIWSLMWSWSHFSLFNFNVCSNHLNTS
jgi:hypothetical protein